MVTMMQSWFPDAKLGIFIHYGIYAVKGIPESWSFFNGQISHEDYMAQVDGFTAANYDPEAWANLFERVGAKYAVLTTKHHDGVALWDTDANDLSVVKKTPAGRDLITPYAEALRRHGLKVGFYFSHLDWTHPDYATVRPLRDENAGTTTEHLNLDMNPFSAPPAGQEDPERWERFLQFHRQQLEELCTRFGKIDLLWFDGDWERTAEQFRMKELRDQLHAWQPEVILNSRMLGYGDYATPEQGIPTYAPEGPWEFCVTINDSWGYQVQDHNHKSVRQLVRMFAEVIAMGGNMLLDVGPKEDGTILPEQVERLEGLGDWIRKHSEAVYGTVAGLPPGLFYGASTVSKDRTTVYLIFFDRPFDQIALKGLKNEVVRCSVVGSGQELTHQKLGGASWEGIPGVLWIDVPPEAVDPNATVVKLELDGPVDLYTGKGRH
jgi:alpha-L-fucosidase